ncbi:UDP-glucose:glycoprotein glucosyltransferase [Diplonema papillatum]|nr:UDP-glucose:glycoprotein glucosyltransferase [Diplonema papillatum]
MRRAAVVGAAGLVLPLPLLLLLLLPAPAGAKSTKVTLSAKWNDTSLIHEAAEYFRETRGPAGFWLFADQAAAFSDLSTAEEAYQASTAAARQAGGEEALGLLSFALSTRYYSPRVLAQETLCRSISDAPPPFAVVGGEVLTTPEALDAALSKLAGAPPPVDEYPFDHRPLQPHEKPAHDAPAGVVCAALVNGAGGDLRSVFDKHAAAYVFRLAAAPAADAPPPHGGMALQGFGVSMTIKNMEYKAMDDKKTEGDAAAPAESAEDDAGEEDENPDEVIMGVRFKAVKERYPADAQSIADLKQKLSDEASSAERVVDVNLQVWQIPNLGYQAAYKVLKHAEDPLGMMKDLSQDFPRHANALSRVSSPGVKRIKKAIQKEMRNHPFFPQEPGASALYVNNEPVDVEDLSSLDLFALLAEHRKRLGATEEILTAGTEGFPGFSRGEAQALLANLSAADAAAGAEDGAPGPVRVRMEEGAARWIVDIEKDGTFAGMPKKLSVLASPSAYGPRFPKRNVFSATHIIDPLDRSHYAGLGIAGHLLRQGAPIRHGVIFVGSVDAAASDTDSDTVRAAVVCATKSLVNVSPMHALSFLGQLGRKPAGAASDAVTLDEVRDLWETIGMADFDDVIAGEGCGAEVETNTAAVRKAQLLSADATMLFNGIVAKNDPQALIPLFEEELARVTTWVREKELRDEVASIYDWILEKSNARDTYQPALTEEAVYVAEGEIPSVLRALDGINDRWIKHTSPDMKQDRVGGGSIANDPLAAVTFVLLVDPTTAAGIATTKTLVDYLESDGFTHSKQSRGAILPHPSAPAALKEGFSTLLRLCAERRVCQESLDALPAGGMPPAEDPAATCTADGGDACGSSDDSPPPQYLDVFGAHGRAGVLAGQSALFVNGRVIMLGGPDSSAGGSESALLSLEDFDFLAATHGAPAGPVVGAFEAAPWSHDAGWAPVNNRLAAAAALSSLNAARIADNLEANPSLAPGPAGQLLQAGARVEPLGRQACPKVCRIGFRVLSGGRPSPLSPGEGEAVAPSCHRVVVVAFLDPLSADAQKVSGILHHLALQSAIDVDISVFLNPVASLTEVPLRSYFRYVMQTKPKFTKDGSIDAPHALFTRLPESQVLTMGMHEPEPWITTTKAAVHDLDNIKLDDVPSPVLTAEYELEAIVVSGSCVEAKKNEPPRGLPLELSPIIPSGAGTATDTLVMSNLGYFQLKAEPGAWRLSVQAGTRGADIFSIAGVSERSAAAADAVKLLPEAGVAQVVVDKFSGVAAKLSVQRKPGMEAADLLEETDEEKQEAKIRAERKRIQRAAAGKKAKLRVEKSAAEKKKAAKTKERGILDQISDLLSQNRDEGPAGEEASADEDLDLPPLPVKTVPLGDDGRPVRPTLNIFSLASGHLYERFLKIMVHTAMLHSNGTAEHPTRVKFWFINNFLSPKFKRTIHKMAEKWGFEVGLLTYKWPKWLRRQPQKMRMIWGYKVLFLDVLFPLDVEKIIFVDADQIVRSDLHELYNLDIDGKAVAYTPFCVENANEETTGFRFWDQGYWHDHLQGRPYHISAIYVVDLKRFRRMAAGDMYRSIYDNLSKDPNSLSNLDQDLPNYSQNMVPIFSLPEHWLWCETWCNQESKAAAKTIDLCNNPATKAPKLVAAKRIVPEWVDYDRLIEEFDASCGEA